MAQLRQAGPAMVLQLLENYRAPDPVFDWERYLMEALACLALAEQALAEHRPGLAASMLQQASHAGENTPYYTPETERRRLLLLSRTGTENAAVLASLLPDNTEELLLRAKAALENKDFTQAHAREMNGILRRVSGWTTAFKVNCGSIYGRQRGFKLELQAGLDAGNDDF